MLAAPQPEPGSSSGTNQGALKRNQACHRCRRRKLKCDAQRPCSGCLKASAQAAATGKDISQFECVYDDIPEKPPVRGPSKRYMLLETRINELEDLLKEKDDAMQQLLTALKQHSISPSTAARPSNNSQPLAMNPSDPLSYLFSDAISSAVSASAIITQVDQNVFSLDQLQPSPAVSTTVPFHVGDPPSLASNSSAGTSKNVMDPTFPPITQTSKPDPLTELLFLGWPSRLPAPDLLLHLVEIFFISHPHAPRLLHRTSFMASLSLPPTHPEFPNQCLLHAICAFSSYFSKAVQGPALPDLTVRPAVEVFHEKGRLETGRPETFGEVQARLAMKAQDDTVMVGEHLLEALQSCCVLAWFYYYSARWFEFWLITGRAVNCSVPLGLTTTATHGPLLRSFKPPSIIPPPATTIEAEMRRNVFWIAYSLERWQVSFSGWVPTLADEDINQVMPVTASDFELGVRIPLEERQRIHAAQMLTRHPKDQTDSFTLYIKGTVILSMIKTFGVRFKTKYYASRHPSAMANVLFTPLDDHVTSSRSDAEHWEPENPIRVDPRESSGFQALDTLVTAYALSFPRHLREPVVNGVVDTDLYVANLLPQMATILLHDTFAEVDSPTCRSASKLLQAARNIMKLLYSVCSTSFDLALLHHNVSFTWFTAGRILVRFVKAKLDRGEVEEAQEIRGEVEVIRLALERFGERIPLGVRQAKKLDDMLTEALSEFRVFPKQACAGTGPLSQLTRSATIEEITPLNVGLISNVAQDNTLDLGES